MKHEPFVIERTYNAPAERVWKAITDKDAMKQWYFEIAEFEPKVGFQFQFEGKDHDGNVYLHLCTITEVVPLKKLQHTWEYEGHPGSTLVTIELFAEGNKTRVKLTHEGLETLPNLPAFAKQNFAEGWTEIIGTLLTEFVEEEIIRKEVGVNASAEKVWDVFVNTDKIRQWGTAFLEGTYVESEFKLGAELLWKTPDGEAMVRGAITELEAPKTLKVSFYDDVANTEPGLGQYYERYSVKETAGQTVIAIESGPLPIKYTKMHAPMWDKALDIMKSIAEG